MKKIIMPSDAQTKFTASYSHGGFTWCVHFYAVDWNDAEMKIESIRETLKLDGEIVGEIPTESTFSKN